MNEGDEGREARRWLSYAQEDLDAAQAMANQPGCAPRHACWLAQQGAEKALKAALVFLQIEFPWRHDLDALRNLLPDGWDARSSHPDLSELTEWAVEARYPSDLPDPTDEDARQAVEQAQGVWESICTDLAARGLTVSDGGGPKNGG